MKNKKKHLKNGLPTHIKEAEDIRQFQIKIETWRQLLEFKTEENVFLKNSIADILRNNYDQNSLEEIEEFQTRFIKMDELIHSLKGKINNSAELPYIQISGDADAEKLFFRKMKDLNRDIARFTTRFHLLKSGFIDFQHKM